MSCTSVPTHPCRALQAGVPTHVSAVPPRAKLPAPPPTTGRVIRPQHDTVPHADSHVRPQTRTTPGIASGNGQATYFARVPVMMLNPPHLLAYPKSALPKSGAGRVPGEYP